MVMIGVPEVMAVPFDVPKYVSTLYQQNNPKPYTKPISIIKNKLIESKIKLKFSIGKIMKYVEIKNNPLKKFLINTN